MAFVAGERPAIATNVLEHGPEARRFGDRLARQPLERPLEDQLEHVGAEEGQQRSAVSAGVERRHRPDLDRHAHRVCALDHVDAQRRKPPLVERRNRRRLIGLAREPLERGSEHAAQVERAGSTTPEADGRDAEPVAAAGGPPQEMVGFEGADDSVRRRERERELAGDAASLLLGGIVGTVAGYRRGWVDEVLMRICDMFMAFPSILLPLIVVVVLGPSLVNTAIALAVRGWAPFARLMRGQVLSVKENAYVDAARALGAGHWRIVRRYIWPNSTAPFIALAAIDFGFVILTAAGLGFLGLGAQPPTPEWGVMVAAGLQNLLISGWYAFFAGLTIAVAVLAFSLLGDGLQDLLDPRSQNRN